ncbi:MAG TPA: DNA polymerase Y family protein [Thermomicrobiales bacterium]|nr:DNA polymerase Y family protein [Thermomicrobiales bacterium]
MHIICLHIPHFALRIAVLKQPELDGRPLLLSNLYSTRPIVLDATAEARSKGIRPEITVREAMALCPEVITLPVNPVREASVHDEILDRLEAISPLVESDAEAPGCWYLDFTGLERHDTSPMHAAHRVLSTVPAVFRPRAGIAPSQFAARVAASLAAPGNITSVEANNVRTFLRPTPVTWLPVPGALIDQLQQLGLNTLGDVAAIPPAKLATRFGPAGRTIWELAQGIDPRPITPRPWIESFSETLTMPTPAISREMLLVGLRQLITRMGNRPGMRGKQAREIRLRATIERGESWERTLVLKEPCGPRRLIQALELRLQALELPGPIETITLELRGIEQEFARQHALPQFQARHDSPLTTAVHLLKQRYGDSPLYRIVEVEPWSRIPERRHALVTYDR